MAARSPEIQAHYAWLAQHFPREAGRVVIVTPGAGETPEDVRRVEGARVADPAYAARLQEMQRRAGETLGFAGMHTFSGGEGGAPAPVAFVHVRTHDITQQNAADQTRLNQLLASAPGGQTAAWRDMMTAYVSRQELGHAVDQLSRWRPTVPATEEMDDFTRRARRLAGAQKSLRTEATGEVFSALDLMQRGLRGEFPAPVRPFLERVQQFHQWSLMGSPQGLAAEAGKHQMVDEAIAVALQWGERNAEALARLSPPALLHAARGLADTLAYPSSEQLDRLLSLLAQRPEELKIGTVPGVTLAETLDKITTGTEDSWVRQQLAQARAALEQLHNPEAPVLQDVCWPADKAAKSQPTPLAITPDAQVNVPFRNGKILKAEPCASSFSSAPKPPMP